MNHAFGSDLPTVFSTEGAWEHMDARLTDKGIEQCLEARTGSMLEGVNPELVVVSPLTRTLQTAHVMFAGRNLPFIVHDSCRERWGKYTCDKRRSKSDIVRDIAPLFADTHDAIDFDSFAFAEEDDVKWTEEREPDDSCTARGVELLRWLSTRPESSIAVVTHSSYLRHLFRAFGFSLASRDKEHLHRTTGNAELRSVTLALHKGFYPPGKWENDVFTPDHPSFRRGRWAVADKTLASMHKSLSVHNK